MKNYSRWLMATFALACSHCTQETEPQSPDAGFAPSSQVFIQPTRRCQAPLEGQEPGQSPGGEVCTWQGIAGATEEGRSFRDYADCEIVRTQRPYYPMPPAADGSKEDPRMEDEDYLEELAWVRGQIDASGCSCCHSNAAPKGPVRWTIDVPGNWMQTLSDRDVAALADLISTEMFGRFPPDQNNNFIRAGGIPSTDPQRAINFFTQELNYRGLSAENFVNAPPTGGPLLEQEAFEPQPCQHGEGVRSDGTIFWQGGPARYIYVLETRSKNPTVPPNLDIPEGILWRLDVHHTAGPLAPGKVSYGDSSRSGTNQKYPLKGAAPELESGRQYYLYISRDVVQPITRCLFTYQ